MILKASAANGSAGSACRSMTISSSFDRVALDRRNVERARQEVHDRVQHRLHALVLERAAAQHRGHAAGDGGPPDRGDELLRRRARCPRGRAPSSPRRSRRWSRPACRATRGPPRAWSAGMSTTSYLSPLPSVCQSSAAHADQVDDAAEVGLDAPRQLDDQRGRAQPVGDHLDAAVELGADPVHLVDEADPRHAVAVGLPPDGLGLRLDAGDAVEDRDRAVEHAQRALHLDGEVDVAGRVDDVDGVVTPAW